MRRLTFITLTLLLIVSCKKEINSKNNFSGYIENVKTALKDSLSASDYATLDFSKPVLSKVDSVQLYLLRIPLKGKNIKNDFVLVKTNAGGKVERGKIIHLDGAEKQGRVDGDITISSLNRSTQLNSTINNGYISALHPQTNLRTSSLEPAYSSATTLPEVIVYCYLDSYGGLSFSDWYLLESFFYDYGGGGSYEGSYSEDYYGPLDGSGGGGSLGGGGYSGDGSTGGSILLDPVIEIEEEYIYTLPGIDLNKIFKCFDGVPSAGAYYTIKLCSDIPSNNNPGGSANFSAASGGHTFLTITKTNGSSGVTQSFGFYPSSTPSAWDPFAPVTSEIKDNGLQEINAGIEMDITENQFNAIKQNAITWTSKNYQLADYNCSNYAIDIFNSVRTIPLIIPGYQIILPGSTNPWAPGSQVTVTIDKSPQMLFLKLQEMKNRNDPEAANIRIDLSHNYKAPVSKGECN